MEFRQDLVDTSEKAADWAGRSRPLYGPVGAFHERVKISRCLSVIKRRLLAEHTASTAEDRMTAIDDLDATTQVEIEAAVLRRLISHLDENKDVQNIDLMNLAGFCRNCLSKWYVAEAETRGAAVDYEAARERICGMPYGEWKTRYQGEANAEQLAAFAAKRST